MTLFLGQKSFLASGGARDVYIHPDDHRLCIKIQRVNGTKNRNEESFFKRHPNYYFLASYQGKIETNLGVGLIYEIIRDFDGNLSKSLLHYLKSGEITAEKAIAYIKSLEANMIENKCLLHDGGLQNILLQRVENKTFNPIIIDGFGVKDRSLKYWLRDKIPLVAESKTKKQARIMIERVNMITSPANNR